MTWWFSSRGVCGSWCWWALRSASSASSLHVSGAERRHESKCVCIWQWIVAQVDGFMRQNSNTNGSAMQVSVGEWSSLLWSYVACCLVWWGEVHVGNEWGSGTVHELDTGKWERARWMISRERLLLFIGDRYHHRSMFDGGRECLLKWSNLYSNEVERRRKKPCWRKNDRMWQFDETRRGAWHTTPFEDLILLPSLWNSCWPQRWLYRDFVIDWRSAI